MFVHWFLKLSDDKSKCFTYLSTSLCVFIYKDTGVKFPWYRCWATQQAQLYEKLSSSIPRRFYHFIFPLEFNKSPSYPIVCKHYILPVLI